MALAPLFFVVALLYSSVGHGGASGYLALMSLFLSISSAQASTTALLLNLLVASLSSVSYWRAGQFSLRLTWPFTLTSVPAAFLGGLLSVAAEAYSALLAAVLFFASLRLLFVVPVKEGVLVVPRLPVSLAIGGFIGLLSGIVGVGGGIFLSPLILLIRWADAKTTAAASAVFIVVNSMAGLVGRLAGGNFETGPMIPLVVAALLGGTLGSYLGAHRFSGLFLRRLLAIALLAAVGKLVQGLL